MVSLTGKFCFTDPEAGAIAKPLSGLFCGFFLVISDCLSVVQGFVETELASIFLVNYLQGQIFAT